MSQKPDVGEELWRIQAEAQGFRSRGEAIYPGRLLVLRGGSSCVHPVDDDAFDPRTECLMGVAVWGPCADFALGMVRFEDGPAGRFVPLVAGEASRPSTGIGSIDAWIGRADALRKLWRGTAVAFGAIPLTQSQLMASVGEIERVVRKSAVALLRNAPRDQRPVLMALAQVADAEHPEDERLTTAILELMASAPAWVPGASTDRQEQPREQAASGSTSVERLGSGRSKVGPDAAGE